MKPSKCRAQQPECGFRVLPCSSIATLWSITCALFLTTGISGANTVTVTPSPNANKCKKQTKQKHGDEKTYDAAQPASEKNPLWAVGGVYTDIIASVAPKGTHPKSELKKQAKTLVRCLVR